MRHFFVLAPLAALTVTLAPAPGRPPIRLSEEDASYNALVDGWYRRYLRRPAESYRSDAVAMLKAGTPQETILAGILAGPEYYGVAGGNERQFVSRLVADVTGRPATPREIGYLHDRLRREERNQAIYEFLTLHPEGLQVEQRRPEPPYEYRRSLHRDYDHDRWGRGDR